MRIQTFCCRTLVLLLLTVSRCAVHGQEKRAPLTITHLTGDFYIYETWQPLDGGFYPSNSMYLVTKAGVVLFDTPWDSTQFQPLLDSIERRHHQKAIFCIATHFHADRTAGLEYYASKGIQTWSSKMTYDLCATRHQKQAQHYFANDTTFQVGGYTFLTFYPGGGHTIDNIVIWIPSQRILYGGCFIKSTAADDLGFLGDADTVSYAASVRKVIARFRSPAFVIPGHLDWHNPQSLKHTLQMAEKL